MGLAIFIRLNEEAIVAEWQAFAQTYLPSAEHMDRSALRDHVIGLLRFIADDLETPETESERSQKAKGQRPRGGGNQDGAADTHADLRYAAGFDTVEMISEFRALRASVIKLWRGEWTKIDDVLPDLLRFNEAIDQIMTESLSSFIKKFNHSGNQVIATLVNDIRKPLLELRESAQFLLEKNNLDAADAHLVSQIATASFRVTGIVSEVIDTVGSSLRNNGAKSLLPADSTTAADKVAKKFTSRSPNKQQQ